MRTSSKNRNFRRFYGLFDINRNYIVQLYCDTDNGNFMNNYILYVLGTIIIIC